MSLYIYIYLFTNANFLFIIYNGETKTYLLKNISNFTYICTHILYIYNIKLIFYLLNNRLLMSL